MPLQLQHSHHAPWLSTMASASGTAERPTPLRSATPYPPIIAQPLSAGLLPEGRQFTPMAPTHTPMHTEGTDYPLPTTIPYSNSHNYPPTGAAAATTRNHHFRSTHHLSAQPLQEAGLEELERSTDRDLLPPREPGTTADRRADDLRSWTSVIIPERKGTIFGHAPLAGSFSGDQAVGARHPRPPLHSASSEGPAAGWHRREREGLAPDLPRAPGALPGLNSMPSLVDRPDLGLPLGEMGPGVDSRSLRYGTHQEYPLLCMEEPEEKKMGSEMRMLTEMPMPMIDDGYRQASSGYGNVNGGVDVNGDANGYGGRGMEMYWHPTSSLPIKIESPPP